jgi:hypothetical protein
VSSATSRLLPDEGRKAGKTFPVGPVATYPPQILLSHNHMGCNNTWTFCIVPALRGRETDRRPGEILAEIRALVAEGVQEVTLLGQNVNAYGVEFSDRPPIRMRSRAARQQSGYPSLSTSQYITSKSPASSRKPWSAFPIR